MATSEEQIVRNLENIRHKKVEVDNTLQQVERNVILHMKDAEFRVK